MGSTSHSENAQSVEVSLGVRPATLEAIQRNRVWFIVLGVALVIVGALAISASFIASMATVMAFGVLLVAAGVFQMIGALFSHKWSGFFLELLAGVLYLVVGILMLAHPLAALAGITLMIGAFFLVGGVARIIIALTERFESWGWVLLHGVIGLLLGILILSQWPLSGLWVVGLFVGIEMIFCGWAWLMLATALAPALQESS